MNPVLLKLGQLVAHNMNQNTAMERAAVASAQGLDPKAYATPFPGETSNATTTTTTTTINNNGSSGMLKGSILAATLLTLGGAGAYSLNNMRKPEEKPPIVSPQTDAKPAETVKVKPLGDQEYDAVYEVQQPDGSWKEVKRERLKTKKDK
jgi:hypothetical protein